MIILGGIGIVAGVWADLSALAIAVFLFGTAFFIHNFWTLPKDDAMARLQDMTQFQRDLALLGASLVFFAVTAFGGEFGAFGDRAAVRPVAAVARDAATWRSRPGRADVASGRS